jgi:hypothetical protein
MKFKEIFLTLMLIYMGVFAFAQRQELTRVTVTMTNDTVREFVVTASGKLLFDAENLIIDIAQDNELETILRADIRTITFTDESVIGLSEHEQDAAIRLFPNPATTHITVAGIEHNTPIFIYSLDGKLLLAQRVNPNGTIDIAALPKGFYFAKVNKTVVKLVKL